MPDLDPRSVLPETWSASAKTTYIRIRETRDDFDPASLASLFEACEMLATADTMQLRVDADGLLIPGSQGQLVAHPLIDKVLRARAQHLAALKGLVPPAAKSGSAASRAGTALVNARYGR